MQTKLERAKQLCNDKHFVEAKQVILEIIKSNQYDNYKLLSKLGDISVELMDFNNAKKYYQESINENSKNVKVLIKFGNLLHEELNNNDKSELMYKKCLKIDPKNDQCLFNYAILKEKQNDYNTAKQLYLQCLQINNNRACVHYRFGKLLMKNKKNNHDDERIDYLLQKAICLQPKIAKYHHQYGIYLISMGKYNRANHSYKIALDLVNYDDMYLLYDYSTFLMDYLNDTNQALIYLEIASILAQSNMNASYIIDEYIELKSALTIKTPCNDIDDIKNDNNQCMQLIIYDFDSIITYWDLCKFIDGDIKNLYNMNTNDIIALFGGSDRIHRLNKHFQQILSQNNNNNKIIILSVNQSDIIIEALKRVKLYQYFTMIIGSDTSPFLKKRKWKIDDIIKLKDDFKIYSSKQVLFIDHDAEYIKNVDTECTAYYIQRTCIDSLRGPKFQDFDCIECIISNKPYIAKEINQNNGISLSEINKELYYNIKGEIIAMREHESTEELSSIEWMNKNWSSNIHRKSFIEFAENFACIVGAMNAVRSEWWTASQILQQTLYLERKDSELYARFAKCLSCLNHMDSADKYYKLAFKYGGNDNYVILVSYSYHLMHWNRHNEAVKYFKKALSASRYGNTDRNLCCGLARVMRHLEKYQEAEIYFKLGIEGDAKANTFYEPIHFYYGNFLKHQNRFKETKHEFELCVTYRPEKSMNHYRLADVLLLLNDTEGYEYHLKKALEIDPYLPEARRAWKKYYKKQYIEDVFYQHVDNEEEEEEEEERKRKNNNETTKGGPIEKNKNDKKKKKVIVDCYNSEFDRFWFDIFGNTIPIYTRYYDRFCEFGMNDIRCIVFNKQIENDLRDKIGITKLDDIGIIINEINLYKNKCEIFSKWLKDNKLYQFFYPILHCNAIYTMECFDYNVTHKCKLREIIDVYSNINYDDEWIEKFWRAKDKYHLNGRKNKQINRYQHTQS